MLISHASLPASASFHLKTIEHPGWLESHVTIPGPLGGEDFQQVREHLAGGMEATILGVDLFGSAAEIALMAKAVKRAGIPVPVTSVLSSSSGGGGMQFIAASGCEPVPVILRDQLTGFLIQAAGTSYCFLGGLEPSDPESSREAQTQEVFGTIEEALALADLGFTDVVRTWFYNENILEWYPAFNGVRTKFFQRHAIRRMPASTGIGAPNPSRTAIVGKAVAVRTGNDGIRTRRSPLQCDAFAYGSAFSRAIEVTDSCSRTLFISGTASIKPGGQSAHNGDPTRQIELTMDVVCAILEEAGMKLEDTTRAVAYFRDPSHIAHWDDFYLKLPALPAVTLGCQVCRDDLLFEIELDVASASTCTFMS